MIEVTAVPGDDPEVFRQALEVVSRTGVDITWSFTTDAIAGARRTGRALRGHRGWTGEGQAPAILMRRELGVFAQHRPVRPLRGLACRYPELDLVVIRETTEDVYARLEHETVPDVFESLKITTRAACERIARHAFTFARATGRSRVTVVHKSNIMKLSDGMFLRVGQAVAEEFPEIACDEVIVDALCMKLVTDPSRFDVLLCGNLYGDIVSDLCAGLAGGPSNAPVVDVALDGTTLFTSGLAATDPTDPLPVLLAAVELLRHCQRDGEAQALLRAIEDTLVAGVRPDRAFCAAVEQRLS